MTTKAYLQGKLDIASGTVVWPSASLYAILVSSAYTFSESHTTYSQVSTHEIADADYAPVDVAGASVGLVDTDDVLYDCNNISFGDPVTINASGGHMIILVGDEADPQPTDRLLFARQMENPAASTNDNFTVTTPNGVMRLNAV